MTAVGILRTIFILYVLVEGENLLALVSGRPLAAFAAFFQSPDRGHVDPFGHVQLGRRDAPVAGDVEFRFVDGDHVDRVFDPACRAHDCPVKSHLESIAEIPHVVVEKSDVPAGFQVDDSDVRMKIVHADLTLDAFDFRADYSFCDPAGQQQFFGDLRVCHDIFLHGGDLVEILGRDDFALLRRKPVLISFRLPAVVLAGALVYRGVADDICRVESFLSFEDQFMRGRAESVFRFFGLLIDPGYRGEILVRHFLKAGQHVA